MLQELIYEYLLKNKAKLNELLQEAKKLNIHDAKRFTLENIVTEVSA